MWNRKDKGQTLREALQKALERDRPRELIAALQALADTEPEEPRWPHRLGDAFKKAGRRADAEKEYLRAMDLFQRQGFVMRAVAVAKLVVDMNPQRADILERLDQKVARSLRGQAPCLADPAFRPPPPVPVPAAALRALADEQSPPPAPVPLPGHDQPRPSFVGGIPRSGLAALAVPLRRAESALEDEVRYADVPAEASITVEIGDLDVMEVASLSDPTEDPMVASALEAERLIHLSASKLFVDVPREALIELARASQLLTLQASEPIVRRGESADALFVIVEGTAHVVLSWLQAGGIDLREGQVFGEACLLRDATRQADVIAKRELLLLRIPREALHDIVSKHADVHRVLFDLLVTRQLANTLQTSPLFAAFDGTQRRALAKLFEVRQAGPGVVLEQRGKRSDGLYLALAGELEVVQGDALGPLPLGALLGHASILGRAPARRTVMAVGDSIVLRMPAARFVEFAAQFPPALAYLADLASRAGAL